jgi:signal transduction histidine kinase
MDRPGSGPMKGFRTMSDLNRRVVEGFDAAILLIDTMGRVVLANGKSSQLLGRDLTGSDIVTERLEDDLPLLEAVANLYGECVSNHQSGRELIATTDTTGSHFYWVTVSQSEGTGGAGQDRVIVVVDISEPVMEGPAIRKVFSQISHDLRSPLTSIAGAAELLQSGRVGAMEPVQARLVRIVEEGARKMGEILATTKGSLAEAGAVGGKGVE